MKDQDDVPAQREIDDPQSSTLSLHYNTVNSIPYATPPWATPGSAMMNTFTDLHTNEADQETVDDTDFFGSKMSTVDTFPSSLKSNSPPISPTFETEAGPDHSPYLQETNVQLLPTPPGVLEQVQESAKMLSLSTAFNNGTFAGITQPDLVLVSSDETLFYLHGTILSGTSFYQALANIYSQSPADSTTTVSLYPCPLPEDSNKVWVKVKDITADELNIVLHALYNTSCASHQPNFDTIERAIDKMVSLFGLVVKAVICPGKEFYSYLLTITPLHPLQVYALAAYHDIHSLAVKASGHLLSYPIGEISDEESERMGAIYLRKLFLLHAERKERLIGLLVASPRPHASVTGCGLREQRTLKTLWAGTLVNIMYDMRADVSSNALQRAFDPLKEQLQCSHCVDTLQIKINEITRAWVLVKHTI